MSFSQQAMNKYMQKHEEKKSDDELIKKVQDSGYTFRPDFAMTQGEATEAPGNSMASKFTAGSDIKAHHLLVLLLRLRQICNHPGLIKTMLEEETKAAEVCSDIFVDIPKGQLISKCPFGVIVCTKIPTKNLANFCPSI